MNRKQKLLPLDKNEQVYQEYFKLCPEVYNAQKYPYHNWEEFSEIFAKETGSHSTLQKTPPTYMDRELHENDWFPRNEDVSMLINARFCPPFWHHLNFIKITYVLNGECFFFCGGKRKMNLKKGDFVIVPPDVEQTVFSCGENDIVFNVFIRKSTFENAFSSLLAESKLLSRFFWNVLYGKSESNIIHMAGAADSKLDTLVLDMYDVARTDVPNRNFLLVSNVMLFFAHVLAYHSEELESLAQECHKENIPDIIRYIRNHYNTVTLTQLAEHFHKSEGYLCRYIRQETGYSLTCLLKQYRMKQAALMLRDSDCSIESIMQQVGYTDISYFYKTFKKYYGMTPAGYRNHGKIIQL